MGQTKKIAAIILAAGTASRMGEPKQLLIVNGKKLLEHTIALTLPIPFTEIMTVIGYEAERIVNKIEVNDSRFRWLVNEAYKEGQSSSLKCAIRALREEIKSVMIFLGDVPFIKQDTVTSIINEGLKMAEEIDEPFVIRPTYKGKSGHPVFFGNIDRTLFEQIQGDVGAKKIIQRIENITFLPVDDEAILFDVDTPADYESAKSMQSNL